MSHYKFIFENKKLLQKSVETECHLVGGWWKREAVWSLQTTPSTPMVLEIQALTIALEIYMVALKENTF